MTVFIYKPDRPNLQLSAIWRDKWAFDDKANAKGGLFGEGNIMLPCMLAQSVCKHFPCSDGKAMREKEFGLPFTGPMSRRQQIVDHLDLGYLQAICMRELHGTTNSTRRLRSSVIFRENNLVTVCRNSFVIAGDFPVAVIPVKQRCRIHRRQDFGKR